MIANPSEVTMVKAVPLFCSSTLFATNAENCGESEVTAKPQTNNSAAKKEKENWKKNGAATQHNPESRRE